jgi:hypothetical protein
MLTEDGVLIVRLSWTYYSSRRSERLRVLMTLPQKILLQCNWFSLFKQDVIHVQFNPAYNAYYLVVIRCEPHVLLFCMCSSVVLCLENVIIGGYRAS